MSERSRTHPSSSVILWIRDRRRTGAARTAAGHTLLPIGKVSTVLRFVSSHRCSAGSESTIIHIHAYGVVAAPHGAALECSLRYVATRLRRPRFWTAVFLPLLLANAVVG